MAPNRLLDYFAICGLKCPLSDDDEDSLDIRQSNFNLDLGYVSELELRVTAHNDDLRSVDREVEYLLLSRTATSKLWLKVSYGNSKGDGVALHDLMLVHAEIRGRAIVLPQGFCYTPVRLHETSMDHHSNTESEGHRYYYGNYDLTDFLGAKRHSNTRLILVYSYSTKLSEAPITHIQLQASDTKASEGMHFITVPKHYNSLPVRMGSAKDSLLVFKRRLDYTQLTFKPHLLEHFPREKHADLPLQAVELFCFPDGMKLTRAPAPLQVFSFVLTTDTGTRTYCSTLVFSEIASPDFLKMMKLPLDKPVYWQKALNLVSKWPYLEQFEAALREIYRRSLIDFGVPIERMVCNLLQEVPLPEPNSAVQVKLLGTNVTFSRSPSTYIPLVPDFSIEILFRALPWSAVVAAYSAALLERKLVLMSDCKALRTHVALALSSLMYPFKWEQVLIPVLPQSLEDYLQAPFPYIIGISSRNCPTDLHQDTVKVVLDKGKVDCDTPLPLLPKELSAILTQRLPRLLRRVALPKVPYLDNSISSHTFPESLVCALKDVFLEFNTTLLKDYHHFLNCSQSHPLSFDFANFRASRCSTNPNSFIYQVTEATHFSMFLENQSESFAYFEEASAFKRTKLNPSFVKPIQHKETQIAVGPNGVSFDISEEFSYETFPALKDCLFSVPR